MKTKLKAHNVEPVQKALSAFNAGEQRVALAHATGTGKSYATCAIIELGNFKNVLYLSPSNHINKYFERVVIRSLGDRKAINILATYSFLLHRDLKALAGKYDLIILDEYHRVGAKEWGKAVKKVLELNQQAKILGLTATEVRYLDNWRDMSKELNFKVVSTITLIDAIERHILPAPEYIIGFSDFNIIIEEREALSIKYKADMEYLEAIKKMKVDWVNSNGLAGIVRHHLPITTSKIVVFSEAIERYDVIVNKMTDILTKAGFKNLKFLRADSSDTKESFKAIDYFSNNNDKNEVKIIISINMLNEGIHADGAEACFMFRKTTSANIFLQQLGRVESSLDPEKKPIVFDLVNNISNDWELFTQIGLNPVGGTTRVSPICVKRIFGKVGIKVYSYVEKFIEIKQKLSRLYKNYEYEQAFQEYKEFLERTGRVPHSRGNKDETRINSWEYRQIKSKNQEVVDLHEQFKSRTIEQKNFTIDFFKEYVRITRGLPKWNSETKEERKLYRWMLYQIRSGNKEVIDIYNKFITKEKKSYSQWLLEYKEFLKNEGHTPSRYSNSKTERDLQTWESGQLRRNNQEIIKLHDQYLQKSSTLNKFLQHIRKTGKLPSPSSKSKEERNLYSWMRYQLKIGNQEVIDIYNRFNPDKPWEG